MQSQVHFPILLTEMQTIYYVYPKTEILIIYLASLKDSFLTSDYKNGTQFIYDYSIYLKSLRNSRAAKTQHFFIAVTEHIFQ